MTSTLPQHEPNGPNSPSATTMPPPRVGFGGGPRSTMGLTRDVIREAFTAAKARVLALRAAQLQPERLAAEQLRKYWEGSNRRVQRTETLEQLLALRTTVRRAFDEMLGAVEDAYTLLDELDAQVRLRSADLDEVYGIEASADSLAAIVDCGLELEAKIESAVLRAGAADVSS